MAEQQLLELLEQQQQLQLQGQQMEEQEPVLLPGFRNVSVDLSPLQPQLQKNKESLEKKLLSRRPMTTLVEQGIMPEYKTSPALHLQRTKLERAKMGDILKSKISHRPERTELVHRHILEDVRPDVDPSLCDRQRQLKRAKLADSLASQLSHRPGPLELIQKNILHTEDRVEQAVKEGTIQFRPTTEGAQTRLEPTSWDEDSSDTAYSPAVEAASPAVESGCSPLPRDASSPSVSALLAQFSELPVTPPPTTSRSARSESLGDITLARGSLGERTDLAGCDLFGGSGGNLASFNEMFSVPNLHRDAPGKERKKLKAKSVSKPGTAPKPKTNFKFHEYKGPPASLKRKKIERRKDKSAYDLLLEQQQVFLQWQLENRNKFPQILLPAIKPETGRSSTLSAGTSSTSGYLSGASSSCASSIVTSPTNSLPGTPRSLTPRESTPTRLVTLTPQDVNNATALLHKLDGMKVSDLKCELKKRQLPVSGSKPALIEKLKPTLEAVIAAGRKQFKQPYKQIPIAQGGLIILKPSPNSQLLTSTSGEGGSGGHESSPEIEQDSPLGPLILPLSPQFTGSSQASGDFSLLGLLSPSDSVHSLATNPEVETILARRDSLASQPDQDRDLGLNFAMEVEPAVTMPPPAPPPPPPPQSARARGGTEPLPLPAPPALQMEVAAQSTAQQFLPPQQTSQQILLAKAQLEAQLATGEGGKVGAGTGLEQSRPLAPRSHGPKGQFIWPPVSVQSSHGAVITIRAGAGSQAPGEADLPQRNTSVISRTPVSQLAAVFSQSGQQPLMVQLPQEPLPASQLGLAVSNTKVSSSLPTTLPRPGPPQDIIEQQQQKIAELQRALARSQQELADQQTGALQPGQEQSTSQATRLRLAHQIHSKHQTGATRPAINTKSSSNELCVNGKAESVEEVLDALLKSQDIPESVQNIGVKVPEKPPSPPPLPLKNSPLEFPPLDLTDMSFDFGLSELPDMMEEEGQVSKPGDSHSSNMEVDMDSMDVQDWLDSLVVPLNSKIQPEINAQYKDKKEEHAGWGQGV